MVARGAIKGYPDGTFRPENKITRAEFVSVLVRAFDLKEGGGQNFADTDGHWAAGAVAIAVRHGIVQGYGNDIFGPDDFITREQMVMMLVKAAGGTPKDGITSFADDSRISDWARGAMALAAESGIINGYPDNTVHPQGDASRAEGVTMIVNALKTDA